MAAPLIVAMPADMEIGGAWTVEWDALDPTTGASVAGVKITDANVVGADLSAGADGSGGSDGGNISVGPFMLVPGPDA